jgi:uncharacterized protein (TIGR02186 family)
VKFAAVFALALSIFALSARAENLVATLGNDRIAIRSNFTGAALSVFGVIERDPSIERAGAYDVVVSVRGPRGAVSVWEKLRLGPFWFNLDQRKYIAIPAFIAVNSNRSLDAITSEPRREELRLGVHNLIPEQIRARRANDPEFREALERIRRGEGLFTSNDAAVKFLSPTVFQTRVEIPGRAPLGAYDVDVAVLADGVLATRKTLNFTVVKSGVEAAFAIVAREDPLLYGVVTAALALLIGWLAAFVFDRR